MSEYRAESSTAGRATAAPASTVPRSAVLLTGLHLLAVAALVAQLPVLATACREVPMAGTESARAAPTVGLAFVTCEAPSPGPFARQAELWTFPSVAALLSTLLGVLVGAGWWFHWARTRPHTAPLTGGRRRRGPPAPVTATVLATHLLALPAVAAQWPALVWTCREEIYPFVDTGRGSDAGLWAVRCAHTTAGEPATVTWWTWPAALAAVALVAGVGVAVRLLRAP